MNSFEIDGIICSWCKRVKDDERGWVYPSTGSDHATPSEFTSHGLCDACYARIAEEFLNKVQYHAFA
jgi:hypothetical protein